MRKRVVGATVAVAAGLALSGCASGGGQAQEPVAPAVGGQQAAGEQVSQAKPASGAPEAGSGDGGRVARPCEATDLDAKFDSHEQPGDFASNAIVSFAKNSDNMTPCVLDGRPRITFMAGSEGGSTLPVKVEETMPDPASQAVPMVL